MKTEADNRRPEHMACLRQALLERRRATRAQLSEATGLSTMTVGKLLAEMEKRGEVRQDETVRLAGGRPSVIASYCGGYAHFATICVQQQDGMSAFTLSVYNLFGEQVSTQRLLLHEVREDSFDFFFEQAQEYRLRLAVFVLPGEEEDDRIFMCDFAALLGGRFLPRIREKYGVATLYENDVNAAVFGRAAGEETDGVYAGVYMPRNFPPGAGLVIDGEILHGHGHFAGEIAFIHGPDAWTSLDYGDSARVTEMIAQLLVIFACTTAPEGMVLYGDFLTPQMEDGLRGQLGARLGRQFDMKIACERDMTRDMERGAVRLGLRRMRALINEY